MSIPGADDHRSAAARAARTARLRRDVQSRAEDRPGVYRMLDGDGNVLYVGRSVRLRTRLLSYFRADRGRKAAGLVRAARSLRWTYQPDAFAVRIREHRLIRKHRPPFNVQHAGGFRHAFVKLTAGPAPRLVAARRTAADGARCFGPFPRPERLEETLRDLARAVGLRDCAAGTPVRFADQGELFDAARTPLCLRGETGSCPAPCAGGCTELAYRERVRCARRFLEGRTGRPVERMRERMRTAAGAGNFEHAARLRDRARRLERLQERVVGFRGRVDALSCVYRVAGFRGDERLYLLRRGLVVDEVVAARGARERGEAVARVRRAFAGPEPGPAGLEPAQAAEILLVARWFEGRPEELERTLEPEAWLERHAPA